MASFQVSNGPAMPRDIRTRQVSQIALCTRSQRTSPSGPPRRVLRPLKIEQSNFDSAQVPRTPFRPASPGRFVCCALPDTTASVCASSQLISHRSALVAKLGKVNFNQLDHPPITYCVVVANDAFETPRQIPLHPVLQRRRYERRQESL